MPDESDAEFAIRNQLWLMSMTGAGGHRGMPHQASKLARSLAKSRIFQ